MKRAVSISIGSSIRDKAVQIELLGEKVQIERIGTDGDMEKAARMYGDLDGQVDAFGVGGADLGLLIDNHWYPLYSVRPMVRFVRKTPLVDGGGLKITLERKVAQVLQSKIGGYLDQVGRRAFVIVGSDRWGMLTSFAEAGYELTVGDLLFTLNIPIALHSPKSVRRLAAILMPVAGRLPFKWVYPTGKDQEKRTPKGQAWFNWGTVIAGDCLYILRYMPDRLEGKVIVTNTTTEADVRQFRNAGVKYLMTTTPVLDGRSFGTNMMEAAIIAACGRTEPVDYAHPGHYLEELEDLLPRLNFEPQLQELN
jgi:hypothetical protein